MATTASTRGAWLRRSPPIDAATAAVAVPAGVVAGFIVYPAVGYLPQFA